MLTRSQLNDDVVALLRDRIYRGDYPPGTPLRQEGLAEELGVSRTPLREAFRTLAGEGLLQVVPGRGVRVTSLDLPRVRAAYEVREVLEGLAARTAAGRGAPGLAPLFTDTLTRQHEAIARDDFATYTNENVRFHHAIWAAARNEFVDAQEHILRLTAQLLVPERVVPITIAGDAVGHHERIAEAILAGDARRAEAEARGHIRNTIRLLAEAGGD
ncbi:GntR family transcriptional regulator [Baekduia soli]|uniref:GntR family transcriptional regulator n=1 Tax=Baekduia soli TaxID=496014 RepID=A0A5B8U0I7_9ACTN|nr:GntR family transcriptional regulator [Baekduia soli]QEC46534.1 GntR family transcriptional regulator [Baekduia soli]